MTVRVKGLRELQRDLKNLDGDVRKGLRKTLAAVAQPVRESAEQLAGSRISNIGSVWPRMRIGITAKSVYVAPKAHRRGGSPRPNLAVLLQGQALDPALEMHSDEISAGVELWLDNVGDRYGF